MKNLTCILVTLVVSFVGGAVQAELRLANIFNDHMVLQQEKPLTIWGWAEPGADVTVTLTESEQQALTVAGEEALRRESPPAQTSVEDPKPIVRIQYVHENAPEFNAVTRKAKARADGRWSVEIEPLAASYRPKFLCAVSGDQKTALIDVLVGEVWVTAGQSNMASGGNRSAWLDNAGLLEPAVRYTVHSSSSPEPLADLPKRSNWRVCEVEGNDTLTGVSTIAYLFAKNLHRQLRVPVGVVNTATGGSLGSEWTGLPELKSIDHPHVKELFDADSKAMPARNFNGRIAPIGRLGVRGAPLGKEGVVVGQGTSTTNPVGRDGENAQGQGSRRRLRAIAESGGDVPKRGRRPAAGPAAAQGNPSGAVAGVGSKLLNRNPQEMGDDVLRTFARVGFGWYHACPDGTVFASEKLDSHN